MTAQSHTASQSTSTPSGSTQSRYSATTVRYVVPTVALFAAGPVMFSITNGLASTTGGSDFSFLLSQSPIAGLTALVASLAMAAIFTALGSALIGAKAGLISGGYVLAWAAWGTGDLTLMLRNTPDLSAGSMILLAVEATIIVLACLAMLVLAAKLDRHPEGSMRECSARGFVKDLASVSGLIPVLAAAAAAVIATVLIAQSGMKGQTIFAALVAGIGASIAAHAASSSETPHPFAPFFGVALAAILAPLVTSVYPGLGQLPKAAVSGEILGYLRLQPADWSVALLIGVPIGLGWTGALVSHHEQSG